MGLNEPKNSGSDASTSDTNHGLLRSGSEGPLGPQSYQATTAPGNGDRGTLTGRRLWRRGLVVDRKLVVWYFERDTRRASLGPSSSPPLSMQARGRFRVERTVDGCADPRRRDLLPRLLVVGSQLPALPTKGPACHEGIQRTICAPILYALGSHPRRGRSRQGNQRVLKNGCCLGGIQIQNFLDPIAHDSPHFIEINICKNDSIRYHRRQAASDEGAQVKVYEIVV